VHGAVWVAESTERADEAAEEGKENPTKKRRLADAADEVTQEVEVEDESIESGQAIAVGEGDSRESSEDRGRHRGGGKDPARDAEALQLEGQFFDEVMTHADNGAEARAVEARRAAARGSERGHGHGRGREQGRGLEGRNEVTVVSEDEESSQEWISTRSAAVSDKRSIGQAPRGSARTGDVARGERPFQRRSRQQLLPEIPEIEKGRR